MTEHQHVVELLTWFVNGRLTAAEHARVAEHLEHCALCREELALQQRVRAAIVQPTKVEFAPQTSFNKLWDKITTDAAPKSSLLGRRPSVTTPAKPWPKLVRYYWMPIALGGQVAIIVALLAILFAHSSIPNNNTAAYYTVTSTDKANDNRPIIHVVFDEAARLSDMKDILGKSGLEIAAGPTAAGVYSLTPDGTGANALQQTVVTLRADPRVRFAELSHP